MTTQEKEKTTATPIGKCASCGVNLITAPEEKHSTPQKCRSCQIVELKAALTTATAARLDAERKVAEMRTALQDVSRRAKEFDDEDCPYAVMSYLRSISDRALSTTLGQGWVSPVEVRAACEIAGRNGALISEGRIAELDREVEQLRFARDTYLDVVKNNKIEHKKQLHTFRERCARLEDALRNFVAWKEKHPQTENYKSELDGHIETAEQALAGSAGGEVCPFCNVNKSALISLPTATIDLKTGEIVEPATIPAGPLA
jgi:hypothetical protein